MRKNLFIAFALMVLTQAASLTAQEVSLTFHGESLSEALRQIDHAQSEKHILFLFDELEMFSVTTRIDHLPVREAVRKVCGNYPVQITEVRDAIFVEYVPKTVHLNPVMVNGARLPLPTMLTADSVPGVMADLQQYARHIVYFNRVCPQEKVYLHLDNTAYFQGETIWYAANVINATTGGEAASKVLYVELLSPTGVILQQQKLKVVDGRCHGSFPLVDAGVEEAVNLRGVVGYPSGYYQIRAYTRAQLNFDEAGIFSRVIPVYRAPDFEGLYDDPIITNYEGGERARPDLPRSEQPKAVNVAFFPEGGHLIEGLSCRVAFKITDENGMGLDVDGIFDANDKALVTTPMHKGMGAFVLVPHKGKEQIVVVKNGKRHTFTLPAAEKKGCTVRLDALKPDIAYVALAGRDMKPGELLGYTLTTSGRVVACDTVRLKDTGNEQAGLITLSKTGMPTGVYQFTLYNASGAILAQRLFFIDNGITTVPISIQQTKPDLQPFDSITLNLQTAKPVTFSLAVRDAADYGTAYSDDIRTYMLLSSELKGLIEEPQWYFERLSDYQTNRLADNSPVSEPNPEHSSASLKSVSLQSKEEALDVLMMVQGWTRYNWRQMAGAEPFEVRHYTEEQLVVDGWAFSRILEKPLTNTQIDAQLYSPDRKLVQKASVVTDSLGYWSIGLDDYMGDWDLFLSAQQLKRRGVPAIYRDNATTRIRLERSSRPKVTPFHPEDIFLPRYTNPYPTIFSWQKDLLPKVDIFKEPGYSDRFQKSRGDTTYFIDEVVIEGKRRYIDYNRFRAFDAHKDTEMDLDEGMYTNNVAGYLESKGYSLQYQYGNTTDGRHLNNNETGFMTIVHVDLETHRTVWRVEYPDSALKLHEGNYYWQIGEGMLRAYDFNRDFTKYGIDGRSLATGGIFPEGTIGGVWDIDMEYVKSVLVFGYEPGHRYEEVVVYLKGIDEFKPRTKRSRETTFTGYTPVVEFYAPSYLKGPIEGDKDYRRTIYWNPEVTTDASGHAKVSFYNNGYSRALTISAEGLTPDGIPIINK
ncbi:MAG: hypothetical protein IK011_01910 [Bacteroidaceae bacterium]|nr:hypothetical protein [Bacteroidaceae bacterium]